MSAISIILFVALILAFLSNVIKMFFSLKRDEKNITFSEREKLEKFDRKWNSSLIDEKQEYLKGLRKQILFFYIFALSFCFLISFGCFFWFLLETKSMTFLDEETISKRMRDAYFFLTLISIPCFIFLWGINKAIVSAYNSRKSIVLSLNQKDFQMLQMLNKQLYFYRKFFPYYIFSENLLYYSNGHHFLGIDISKITKIENLGRFRRFYRTRITHGDKKIDFIIHEIKIHNYLLTTLKERIEKGR